MDSTPASGLLEWVKAFSDIRSNPIYQYSLLNQRRARLRLPWWRRGTVLILLSAGLLVLVFALFVRFESSHAGLGWTLVNPWWVDTLDYATGFLSIALPIWLALATFDAVRQSLSVGQRGHDQIVDDLIALGKLSPVEVLLGSTWPAYLKVSGIALCGLGFGVLSEFADYLIEPFRGEMKFNSGYQPPPESLDAAKFLSQTVGTHHGLDWAAALLASLNTTLFSLIGSPLTLAFGMLFIVSSAAALILLSVCLGAGLGPHLRTGWAGALALTQVAWPLCMIDGDVSSNSSAETVAKLSWLIPCVLICFVGMLCLAAFRKSTAPFLATFLISLLLALLLWGGANAFAFESVLKWGFRPDLSPLTVGLGWLSLDQYLWGLSWPNPYLFWPFNQYKASVILELVAEALLILLPLMIACVCAWFARRAVAQRLQAGAD